MTGHKTGDKLLSHPIMRAIPLWRIQLKSIMPLKCNIINIAQKNQALLT